ncbi:MAG: peroxidase [Planctomycetia bacterium]|nr:peroxidase [Planctomycetia bacterium]
MKRHVNRSVNRNIKRKESVKRKDNRRAPRLGVEQLERRELLAVTTVALLPTTPIAAVTATYSIDGKGNNLANPTWASAGADLLRLAPAAYANGISTPGGATRLDARTISNLVDTHDTEEVKNDRELTALIYAWGQFIDHDLDLTTAGTPAVAFNVPVSPTDPIYTADGKGIPLTRSQTDPATGKSLSNPLQQVNSITGWLDGSMIYGSDAVRAKALRTGVGGKLATSAGDLLPLNTAGLANANDAHVVPENQLFLAGDVRANENVELTSLQTVFMREHNRIADQIAQATPGLSDEQIFQAARRIVIAEIQSITYNEFLPALLGSSAPGAYTGYDPKVNAGIANEFSTAAFRIGHTLVGNDVEFLDNDGNELRDALPLAEAFFNPQVVKDSGVDPILKYLATDKAEEVDTQIVDGLRDFLFGPPGAGGMDLAALNIQRGRDHGLADYNTTRVAYGLPAVKSFADITSDTAVQQELRAAYGTTNGKDNVNNIDLWVGGIAEDHLAGSSVGATFSRIISDQFERLRDGDRLWFERTFSGRQLDALEHTTLSDVIARNTGITTLQENVFYDESVLYYKADGATSQLSVVVGKTTVSIIDRVRGTVLGSHALEGLTRVQIDGSSTASDRVTVDLTDAGGVIPEGILVRGLSGRGDMLTVLGTSKADTFVVGKSDVTLNGQVITYDGVETLQLSLNSRQDRAQLVGRPKARLTFSGLFGFLGSVAQSSPRPDGPNGPGFGGR